MRELLRRTALVALALSFFCTPAGVRGADLPNATGLDRLALLDGKWDVDTNFLDTPISKAHQLDAIVRTTCWKSPGFFTCNESGLAQAPTLSVYAYDSNRDAYSVYYITPDPRHPTRTMTLVAKGSVWTYFGTVTDQMGKRVIFRNVRTFAGTDSIEFVNDVSLDGSHWTTISRGHETRLRN